MQYNPQSNQNITPQHQQNQQFNKNESGIKSNSKDIQEDSAVIFKSIEPQKMPVEENAQNITQEKTNKINSEENLTEEDLDAIQDVDMYEEQETEPQIIEEEEIHEEDDSYLDNITPDEEDIQKAEAEEQNEPSIEEYNEVSQEDFNVENTTQEQQTDENNQDIKTKYNITPESLKEEEHVPIYPANTGDIDVSYEKGDLVIHDKFGKGKVEKIINYGTKKLCSIYFEGLGRRLLDPSLSELRKAD